MIFVERIGCGSDYFVNFQKPMSFEEIVKQNIKDKHNNTVFSLNISYTTSLDKVNKTIENLIPSKFIAFKKINFSTPRTRLGANALILLSEKGSILHLRWDIQDDYCRTDIDEKFSGGDTYISKYENTICNSLTIDENVCSILKYINYDYVSNSTISEAFHSLKFLSEQSIYNKNKDYMLDKIIINMDKTINDTEIMLKEM